MVSIRQLARFFALAGLTAAAPRQEDRSKLRQRQAQALPDYAITYAPLSYLYSSEAWFPSDITTHLANVEPEENYVSSGANGSVTVDTLESYSSDVYLTASDGPILNPVEDSPAWVLSNYGIPDSNGYSAAPGLIIAVELNSTTTNVFYFYFYSYNYGGTVLGINFDDHVGDWEHNMIQFVNGEPYAIWLSQHSTGSAYYFNVLDFDGDRPINYIAYGGHANFATVGSIEYTIALGLITDVTDAGYLWDITQNYRGYWYDIDTAAFSIASGASTGAAEENEETADWLSWEGYWGDEQYSDSVTGQYCIEGECHYSTGPTGPVTKNLGRTTVCIDSPCTIFDNINDVTIQS